uniref:Cyclic GMP-AMP synthase n=1 Tax=Myripristis murdjan TaxID=586833 RepID=A0A667XAG7_9TELE
MSRRGKPRETKIPEANCAMGPGTQTPLCSGPGTAFKEEQNQKIKKEQKPKKREQKRPEHTNETSVPDVKTESACIKTKKGTSTSTSPEHLTDEKPQHRQPETPKGATKVPVPQSNIGQKADVDKILSTTLTKLKIKRKDRAEAAHLINGIIKNIMDYLNKNTECFKDVQDLRTGSYYENLKISNPDEFDVMLTVPISRVDIQPFTDDGAFYSVALKRGKTPLDKFRKENNTISGSEILHEFRNEVKKCVKKTEYVEVEKKKMGCPAVTLLVTGPGSVTLSLDVVLALEVRTCWPHFTKEGFKIEGWLGRKVKQECKGKPYYLVPKYQGRDTWRISFSHVEKAIMKNHGSEKTCCEENGARCCRKDCLKLLKHLLSLLKTKDSSFDKFCSYHVKTILLHACCSRTKDTDWKASHLTQCFLLLLENFESHLRDQDLPNFFIPTQNLLLGPSPKSCILLADRIKEERENGFPIFS